MVNNTNCSLHCQTISIQLFEHSLLLRISSAFEQHQKVRLNLDYVSNVGMVGH